MKKSKVDSFFFIIISIFILFCSSGCKHHTDEIEETESEETEPEGEYIDIVKNDSWELKVGDSIEVYSKGLNNDYYRLRDSDGNISLDILEWDLENRRLLKADKPGSVILCYEPEEETEEAYECVITVTKDENSSQDEKIENMIIGIWKNGESSFLFNKDGSGHIKIVNAGDEVLSSDFKYLVYSSKNENDETSNFLSFSNMSDDLLNDTFTIQISQNLDLEWKLMFYGKLKGLPNPSSWIKE